MINLEAELRAAVARRPQIEVIDTCVACGRPWEGVRWVWVRERDDANHDPGWGGFELLCCGARVMKPYRGRPRISECGSPEEAERIGKHRELRPIAVKT